MPDPRDGFDVDEPAPWEQSGPTLTFATAETITPTRPSWCWDRWLATGSLHLLVGRQGQGKSTFAAWVVGNASTGRPFPGDLPHDPIRCAMLSLAEPADRLVARLSATGADLGEVLILGDVQDLDDDGRPYRRPWRLPGDCSVLEDLLRQQSVELRLVDGLGYTISGDSDNLRGGRVSTVGAGRSRGTHRLLCRRLDPPTEGLERPGDGRIGSTAWTAVARIVWLLGADPDDETGDRRVVTVSKSNFKLPDSAISFESETTSGSRSASSLGSVPAM
jgi:hypothetical protein